MTALPPPETVLDDAVAVGDQTADRHDDSDAINVVVAGTPSSTQITREEGSYHGAGAGALGRLAAATQAVDTRGGQLHTPDPTYTADGPWVVVDALGGRLATVAKGRVTVSVTLAARSGHVDARLTGFRDDLDTLLEAARPRHDIYPVDRDEHGVFTTGLPTVELTDIRVDERPIATFEVYTPPDTNTTDLENRFGSLAPVDAVSVERTHGVDRADPPAPLRSAAETAADRVFGDWEYEWLPGPGAFTWIPDPAKIAVGTGHPDAESFDADDYTQLVTVLEAILDGETTP